MSVIKPLPSWAIVNRFPAFYEGESLTAIEQTARVYGKINELINTYNRYVTTINGELTELETQVQSDLSCAIRTIINLTDSYITQVELRLTHQDRKLDEAYASFTTDITAAVDSIIRQMKEAGELDATILDAIDNLNSKFETLDADITIEQEALKQEYELAKNNLNADYEQYKAEMEHTFNNFSFAMQQRIDENTAFRENTSKVLVQGSKDSSGTVVLGIRVGTPVPNIKDYSIVGVQLTGYDDYCICKVTKTNDGIIYISGVGNGRVGLDDVDENGFVVLSIATVKMTLNWEGIIGHCAAGYIEVGGSGEIKTRAIETDIARIDGLVLNSGNIS